MSAYRNEMCDHFVELTSHCPTCRGMEMAQVYRLDKIFTMLQRAVVVAGATFVMSVIYAIAR